MARRKGERLSVTWRCGHETKPIISSEHTREERSQILNMIRDSATRMDCFDCAAKHGRG